MCVTSDEILSDDNHNGESLAKTKEIRMNHPENEGSSWGGYDCGFAVVCAVVLLGDTCRGITFPTLWPLVQAMGGSEVTQGYVVAAFSLGRIVISPVMGSWSVSVGYRQVLVVSSSVLLLGSLVYALAASSTSLNTHWQWLCLAQFVLGVGSGTLGVTRAYVAEITPPSHRTSAMAWLTAVQYAGFTVTPFFGAAFKSAFSGSETSSSTVLTGPFVLNQFTAPAYVLTTLTIVLLVVLVTVFRDPLTMKYTVVAELDDRDVEPGSMEVHDCGETDKSMKHQGTNESCETSDKHKDEKEIETDHVSAIEEECHDGDAPHAELRQRLPLQLDLGGRDGNDNNSNDVEADLEAARRRYFGSVWPSSWSPLSRYDQVFLGCLGLNVVTKGCIAAFETVGVSLTSITAKHHSEDDAGWVVGACGILGVVVLLAIGWYGGGGGGGRCSILQRWKKNFQKLGDEDEDEADLTESNTNDNTNSKSLLWPDVDLIVYGLIIMCIGTFCVSFQRTTSTSLWIYRAGIFLVYSVGYPVGHTAVIGLFSKIVGNRPQGKFLGWFASAGSLARIIFPILSGYITHFTIIGALFRILALILWLSCIFTILCKDVLEELSST